MDEKRPWKRCDGESERSYRLFLAYLSMGVNRSLRKVVESEGSPCLRVLERKSRRWNWRDRAEAFDQNEVRRIERAMLSRVRRQRSDVLRARLKVSSAVTNHALRVAKAIGEAADTIDLKTLNGIRHLNATMDVMKKAQEATVLGFLDLRDQERELERSVPTIQHDEPDLPEITLDSD